MIELSDGARHGRRQPAIACLPLGASLVAACARFSTHVSHSHGPEMRGTISMRIRWIDVARHDSHRSIDAQYPFGIGFSH
ncbi:hypothetical protein [Burkholderia sp. lig30]|jgi:hypothetical protein|uniref:hypothetical protein n=1 Tax=Burkholderia sp. lig30 TaxID=1192124 RepID=UPI00128F9D7C|nr:hypothetical protein [Burkholderia sp. lig30]